MILKRLPPHRPTIREIREIIVGLYTGGDDSDETGGEDGGHADEGDVGDFFECARDGQADTIIRTAKGAEVREKGRERETYRKDMIAMMAAQAMLQIAPLEMLSRAIAPERACDPATKTDWDKSMRLMNMTLT